MKVNKKPNRKEMLAIITELQLLIGKAIGLHGNDRDPNGYEKGQKILEEAHQLCIEARSFDPPTDC